MTTTTEWRLGQARWHLQMIASQAAKNGRLDDDLTTIWVPFTEQQLACLHDFLDEEQGS